MTCNNCQALKDREENPDEAAPCMRHLAAQNGWKCDSCGSPWVYLIADGSHYDDGEERKLCRPCTYMLIKNKGLNEPIPDSE